MAGVCQELGQDSMDLGLRVGLHSGPVQGGILKGEKKRFQLYGNTVNVTSRMETCGLPGRIHASEETADELVRLGKKSWIVPRDDKISAKGVGLVQTFWIETGDPETSK